MNRRRFLVQSAIAALTISLIPTAAKASVSEIMSVRITTRDNAYRIEGSVVDYIQSSYDHAKSQGGKLVGIELHPDDAKRFSAELQRKALF